MLSALCRNSVDVSAQAFSSVSFTATAESFWCPDARFLMPIPWSQANQRVRLVENETWTTQSSAALPTLLLTKSSQAQGGSSLYHYCNLCQPFHTDTEQRSSLSLSIFSLTGPRNSFISCWTSLWLATGHINVGIIYCCCERKPTSTYRVTSTTVPELIHITSQRRKQTNKQNSRFNQRIAPSAHLLRQRHFKATKKTAPSPSANNTPNLK